MEVASGSLGSHEPLLLPAGNYRVEFDSAPPQQVQINLTARDQLTLTLQKQDNHISHFERHNPLQHASCEEAMEAFEHLGGGKESQEPVQNTLF